MQKLKISGGNKLVGEINISGAKNSALPILAASLLSEKNISLNNVPQLNDIATMITLLQSMGVEVILDDRMRLNLNARNVDRTSSLNHPKRLIYNRDPILHSHIN